MNLLLDTRSLLRWWGAEPMHRNALAALTDPGNLVSVSAATIWELGVKRAQGKLRFEGSVVDHVAATGFEPLPITLAHAERAAELPRHHRDPFARMLIAQAQAEGLRIVTRDSSFEAYDVKLLKA